MPFAPGIATLCLLYRGRGEGRTKFLERPKIYISVAISSCCGTFFQKNLNFLQPLRIQWYLVSAGGVSIQASPSHLSPRGRILRVAGERLPLSYVA